MLGPNIFSLKLFERRTFLQDSQPKYIPAGEQSLCQKNHASLPLKVSHVLPTLNSAISDLTSKNLRYLSTSNLQRYGLEERNSA